MFKKCKKKQKIVKKKKIYKKIAKKNLKKM